MGGKMLRMFERKAKSSRSPIFSGYDYTVRLP